MIAFSCLKIHIRINIIIINYYFCIISMLLLMMMMLLLLLLLFIVFLSFQPKKNNKEFFFLADKCLFGPFFFKFIHGRFNVVCLLSWDQNWPDERINFSLILQTWTTYCILFYITYYPLFQILIIIILSMQYWH